MPIKRELRKFYGPEWQRVTRPRIMARSGGRCENCGKWHLLIIETRLAPRSMGSRMFWRFAPDLAQPHYPNVIEAEPQWFDQQGNAVEPARFYPAERTILVKIGIAHKDHDPQNNSDRNLAAFCQWCHIWHDRDRHAANAHLTRAARKDARRPLFEELTA